MDLHAFSIGMGAWGRAVDGTDPYDTPAYVSSSGWTGGSYLVAGANSWNGPTGFYAYDTRALMLPGETKTWMVYVWAVPVLPRPISLCHGSHLNTSTRQLVQS